MKYYIGTAGFSYRDWEGVFYPKSKDKLTYYSNFFNFVEINSTFYSVPDKQFFISLNKRFKEEFKISIKANQIFTHQNNWKNEELRNFIDLVKILENNLLCVLFQFPYSFHNTKENLQKIENIKSLTQDLNIAVEVRHKSFLNEKFIEFCKVRNIIFVNIDQPQISYNIPLTSFCTNENYSYFRFHGRKEQTWFSENSKSYERYNYIYNENEIEELKEVILKNNAPNIIVSFNNHYKAKAIINAIELKEKLGEKSIISLQQIKRNIDKKDETLI